MGKKKGSDRKGENFGSPMRRQGRRSRGISWMKGLKACPLTWLQEKEKALLAEDPVSSSLQEEEPSGEGKQDPHLSSDLFSLVTGPKRKLFEDGRHGWVFFSLSFFMLSLSLFLCSPYFEGIRSSKRCGKIFRQRTEGQRRCHFSKTIGSCSLNLGASCKSSLHWHSVARWWKTAQGKGFAAQPWQKNRGLTGNSHIRAENRSSKLLKKTWRHSWPHIGGNIVPWSSLLTSETSAFPATK